jgi:hypothetical protein
MVARSLQSRATWRVAMAPSRFQIEAFSGVWPVKPLDFIVTQLIGAASGNQVALTHLSMDNPPTDKFA